MLDTCVSLLLLLCVYMKWGMLLLLPGITLVGISEGIQIEYVAVFLAVLFPGALIAFNCDLLQSLPRVVTLRIYCAGIWHNAVCCAFCALALFMLPLILYPFYIYGGSPLVLEVPISSPLSDFLSSGDLITSINGISIHDTQEWTKMAAHVNGEMLHKLNTSNDNPVTVNMSKGYCVPSSMIETTQNLQLIDHQYSCPNGFSAFATIMCFNSSLVYNHSSEDNIRVGKESVHCLIPKDVVKLKKCSDGLVNYASNKSSCLCSEDETCLSPVQTQDSTWVEITYSTPYNPRCWSIEQNKSANHDTSNFEETGCGGAFVFIGDVMSMAHSIRLASYRPRWPYYFGIYVPSILEKLLVCTFHVSLALALLNSLPVYFLDGESILESTLSHMKLLSPRTRKRVLRSCLLGGTLVSVFAFLRILFFTILNT